MIRYALAVLLLFGMTGYGDSVAAARQRTQKVIYPNGRVVHETVQTEEPAAASPAEKVETAADVPAPQPITLAQNVTGGETKAPCAPCGPVTPENPTGECKKDGTPDIVLSGGDGCEKPREPIEKKNPQVGILSQIDGKTIPFYKNCVNFKATAKIPVIVKNMREKYLFGRQLYGEPCCKYEVCVVKACQCIDTKNCELQPKLVAMKACRRHDDKAPLIDVYVIGEPGFPHEWVLYLGLTEIEYNDMLRGSPVP